MDNNKYTLRFTKFMEFNDKKPSEYIRDFKTNDWITFLNKIRSQARFNILVIKNNINMSDIQEEIGYAYYVSEVAKEFYQHCRNLVTDDEWKTIISSLN